MVFRTAAVFLATSTLVAASVTSSPISKVVQLLSNLEAKITKEDGEAQNTFRDFTFWCQDRSADLNYDIKKGSAAADELSAAIEKSTSTITSLSAKIDDTANAISTDEGDLAAASGIRKKEAADFVIEHKELQDVVSALQRAIQTLESEMLKGGAAMLQMQKAKSLADMMRVMVDASMLQSEDAEKLTMLVQNSQERAEGTEVQAEDDELAQASPEAAAYVSQSGNVIDVLKDLLDKASDELGSAQKKEMNSRHNFEMMKQSLDDEINFANKKLSDAKQGHEAEKESKANADGDLAVTSRTLAEDKKTLKTLNQDCMTKSQSFEAETKSRAEELKALAAAKKVLVDNTGGAASIAYGSDSLIQLHADKTIQKSAAQLKNIEVVHFVRDLARKGNSAELMQLYRNLATVTRDSATTGENPFKKVTGLIKDMLTRLEKEAHADATHKAYCDKELGETLQKKADKEATIDKLSTSIDAMSAKSQQLKDEVANLMKALADMASSQAAATALRHKEKAQFEHNEAETQQGIEGVKAALQVLKEYYSQNSIDHGAAEGAATGIIGLLEVCQSDFVMGLAEMSGAESQSAREYDELTKANQIEKATKDQDVRYKSKESRELDSAIREASSDRKDEQAALDAILQYKSHLIGMCVEKPATYDERQAGRASEIAGLKEALKILSNEDIAFLQHTAIGKHLRIQESMIA